MNYAMRVMNILISIGSLGLGGAEKQAVWLSNQFAADNDVTLITYHGGKRQSELSSKVNWVRLIPEIASEYPYEYLEKSHNESNREFVRAETSFVKNIFSLRTPRLRRSKNEIWLWLKTYLKKSKIAMRFSRSRIVIQVINKFLSSVSLIRSFWEVHKLISNTKPRFVVTFLYHDTLILGLATLLRMNPPRLIVGRRSPFGYCDENRILIEKWLMRWIYRKADAAVTNSTSNVPNAILDGIALEKISLIENFVDSDVNRFRESNEEQLSLLCIANFHHYKNHFNLIKAISNFHGRVKVTFLGEGPLKVAAIDLARDLKVDSKFYGHEDQQDVLTHKMDFFVLPSKFEGNSNALLEALIEGFPAITTPVGIASQLCKIGAPVIVTSGFEVEDFEDAIHRALCEKDYYSSVAKSFMHTIARAHSKQTIFTQWSNLLDNLSASPKEK